MLKSGNSDDPKNLLPEPARQRIQKARLEGERIRQRAFEKVYGEYHSETDRPMAFGAYCDVGQAKIQLGNANLEAALAVLSAIQSEFISAGLPEPKRFRAMAEEIEGAVNSLQLSIPKRDLLRSELLHKEWEMETETPEVTEIPPRDTPRQEPVGDVPSTDAPPLAEIPARGVVQQEPVIDPAAQGRDAVAQVRQDLLMAYKRECKRHGVSINDEVIAKAASSSWNDRTPVKRWKSNDTRSTPADDELILRVLRQKPHIPVK